jgi:hypothetical protein
LVFRPRSLIVVAAVLLFGAAAFGQSSDQSFPTPITESELSGSIRARDIGDGRVTTHFYAFDGAQGDIFVNVVTKNFSGDIDVFTADSLKPLTKMVMYADVGTAETGRVIYMRQPGRLLLRIEGRTPNDDPATYRVKFAGSFVALAPEKAVKPPTVTTAQDTGVIVNSVGTIIAVAPPPKKEEKPVEAVTAPVKKTPPAEAKKRETASAKTEKPPARTGNNPDGPRTVFQNKAKKVTVDETAADEAGEKTETKPKRASTTKPPREKAADPLASVRLVVILKDGTRIEKAMPEVLRFSFDRGMLTVVGKDGAINRYAMAEVASVNVQ